MLPISDKSMDYAEKVLGTLKEQGFRATLDGADERIQAKVRAGAEMKVPYLLVVGPRDAERREVSVRVRGIQKDLGAVGLDAFVDTVSREIETRGEVLVREELFPEAAVPA